MRFTRSEANRALAKMSLKEEDCVPDIEGAQRSALPCVHALSLTCAFGCRAQA